MKYLIEKTIFSAIFRKNKKNTQLSHNFVKMAYFSQISHNFQKTGIFAMFEQEKNDF